MDAARALFQVTDVGAIFGEHATLGRAAELSYKAITRCELYALSVSDLYKVLDKFPSARKELGEYLFEDLIRHRMLRCTQARAQTPD